MNPVAQLEKCIRIKKEFRLETKESRVLWRSTVSGWLGVIIRVILGRKTILWLINFFTPL